MGGILDLLAEYDVLGAFWMTIKLTVISAIGALLLGTVVAPAVREAVAQAGAVTLVTREPSPPFPTDPGPVHRAPAG